MLPSQSRNLIRWYFSLALAEGLGTLLWLLVIPGEGGRHGLLGLSAGRLALMLPLLVLILALAWIVSSLRYREAFSEAWTRRLSQAASRPAIYWGAIAVVALAGMLALILLAFGRQLTDPFVTAYFLRLAPYLVWVIVLSIQTLIMLRALRYGWSLAAFQPYRKALQASLLATLLILLLSAILVWTGVGLKPDAVGWGAPGVPLLASQVGLALTIALAGCALGGIGLYLWNGLRRKPSLNLSSWMLDATVCLLLWLGAVWRWNAEPLKTSYFAPDPTPPNQEYYPYSDAATYDLSAQSLLIGAGFERDVIRPVYSGFVALTQGLSGIGLGSVIAWQVPLLAFIPLLLYLLATALHHRLAGILLGLLAIFHESNSLALAGIIDVSNAKMIMSDLPITLCVVLFSLLMISWLQKPGERRVFPLLAGGVLAISMLIRIQVILLLPAVLLCTGLALRRQMKLWLKGTLVLATGMVLALAPWIWRNWQLTGKLVLADTSNPTQAGMLGRRYSASLEGGNIERLPGETEDQYLARITGGAMQFALQHPVETARFIDAHFWHNQAATLLVLPASFLIQPAQELSVTDLTRASSLRNSLVAQCCSAEAYVRGLPYWMGWDGHLAQALWLPLLANLLLISLGIGAAWARGGFVGLLPLFVAAGYGLSNALARNSGWRYNLPVDWIGLLYYAIGLGQVCFWIATYFDNRTIPRLWQAGMSAQDGADQVEQPFPWKRAALAGAGLFLLVGSLPLAERLIPARYPPGAAQAAISSLLSTSRTQGIDPGVIQRFLSGEDAVALVGRAMYPRFYAAGDGIPHGGWPSYSPRDYSRLGFILVGSDSAPVVLAQEKPPASFPDASDVLVLGCQREDYIEARLVTHLKNDKAVLSASSPPTWDCKSP